MTVEDAIKSIDDVLNSDYHYDESIDYQMTSDDFEWLEKSKEALEKQIPQAVKQFLPLTRAKCPACNEIMGAHASRKYCYYCGQALDWSDNE